MGEAGAGAGFEVVTIRTQGQAPQQGPEPEKAHGAPQGACDEDTSTGKLEHFAASAPEVQLADARACAEQRTGKNHMADVSRHISSSHIQSPTSVLGFAAAALEVQSSSKYNLHKKVAEMSKRKQQANLQLPML